MKHFLNSLTEAAKDAALHMTADVQQSAIKHGWDADVAANTKVSYADGQFKVEVHPDYQDRAFVHEFGNEHRRPTAVLRKYDGQTHAAEKFMVQRLKHHLGGKL